MIFGRHYNPRAPRLSLGRGQRGGSRAGEGTALSSTALTPHPKIRRRIFDLSRGRGGRRFFSETRAAALVEFTLVFPFLLVFLAGLSEFGFAMHQQHIVQKAVRDAARYAARTNYAIRSCPLSAQPEWTQMVTNATTVALYGNLASSGSLLIPTWTGSRGVDVQVTEACFDPASTTPPIFSTAGAGNNIPVITVSASAPYAGVGLLSAIGLSAFEIRAAHSEIWVGL